MEILLRDSDYDAPVLVLGDRKIAPLLPGSEHRVAEQQIDICFVFDTTGSMNDKIDGLVRCMVDFVHELDGLRLDWRISVVPFGDLTVPGDTIEGDLPFVTNRQAAEQMLRSMPMNSGGGNQGESCLEAVEAALNKPYRSGAVTVFILLTDEPALVGPQMTPELISRQLIAQDVIAFVVSPSFSYYQGWASDTGGQWHTIGASVDTGSIVTLLRELAREVATVTSRVYSLAGGSVAMYRALPQTH